MSDEVEIGRGEGAFVDLLNQEMKELLDSLKSNPIRWLVVSENEQENQYAFKHTIRVLGGKITKVIYQKRIIIVNDIFEIRFCTYRDYERLYLSSLHAKEFDGRCFERLMDDYEKEFKGESKDGRKI